jgi:hypothetical protein
LELVKFLMRYFGYLFHGLLSLFLLGAAFMALISDLHTLRFAVLPWTGAALTYWLLGGAVVALASIVLAIQGVLRPLFFLWSLVVLVMLVRGYVFTGYGFSGSVTTELVLLAGAALSLAGAWFGMRRPARA